MGYVPPPLAPWYLSLDSQIAALEPTLSRRFSRLPWRRRSAYSACEHLIRLRQHDLYGENSVSHAGSCPRGDGVCGPKPPPKPLRPADPTLRLV